MHNATKYRNCFLCYFPFFNCYLEVLKAIFCIESNMAGKLSLLLSSHRHFQRLLHLFTPFYAFLCLFMPVLFESFYAYLRRFVAFCTYLRLLVYDLPLIVPFAFVTPMIGVFTTPDAFTQVFVVLFCVLY